MLTNIHSARIYAVHALTVASPANEKSIHSARMYAAQALISAHQSGSERSKPGTGFSDAISRGIRSLQRTKKTAQELFRSCAVKYRFVEEGQGEGTSLGSIHPLEDRENEPSQHISFGVQDLFAWNY